LTGGFRDFIDSKWCKWAPPSTKYYRNIGSGDGIYGIAETCDYKEYANCVLEYIKDSKLR
jgi:hypothetical protein